LRLQRGPKNVDHYHPSLYGDLEKGNLTAATPSIPTGGRDEKVNMGVGFSLPELFTGELRDGGENGPVVL
jgi:hypothetical protein